MITLRTLAPQAYPVSLIPTPFPAKKKSYHYWDDQYFLFWLNNILQFLKSQHLYIEAIRAPETITIGFMLPTPKLSFHSPYTGQFTIHPQTDHYLIKVDSNNEFALVTAIQAAGQQTGCVELVEVTDFPSFKRCCHAFASTQITLCIPAERKAQYEHWLTQIKLDLKIAYSRPLPSAPVYCPETVG